MNNNLNNNPEQDEYVIGEGFEVQEIEIEQPRKHSKRKSKKKKGIFGAIIWVAMIFIIAIFIALSAFEFTGFRFVEKKELMVEIPQGSSASKIADILAEDGPISSSLAFRIYAKFSGYDNQFKYGVYSFETDDSYSEIAKKLIEQGAKAQSVTVTIPEGTGINDFTKNVNGEKVVIPGIATILEKNGVCTKEDFFAALKEIELNGEYLSNSDPDRTYYALEGYLFPETYNFYNYDSKECAKLAIKRMIAEGEKRITPEMYKKAQDMGYNMNQILTMASIIQMEAGTDTEALPKIAAVFYNRLNSDSFATLGSSPTCFYGDSFKRDDERYDTYKAKGLPPGPLCSPSIDAINAALNPDSNDYFYFVTDAKGKFYFHKTLAEQNATINKLKQDKNWIYEYFNK